MNNIRVLFKAVILLSSLLFPALAFADNCGVEFTCQQALVKFDKRADEAQIQNVFQNVDAVPLQYFENIRVYYIQFQKSSPDTLTQIAELRNQANVVMASRNSRVTADALPNDPYFGDLWGLRNTGQSGGVAGVDIGVENVWDTLTDASSILVAVIDTGIDYTHPDLAANIWTNSGEIPGNHIDDDGNGYVDDVHGYDFVNNDGDPMDDHYHGTHVAGTIGAVGNNGVGVTGVAWTAQIMAVKFLDANGSGYYSDAVSAINYAVANGAKILNNSWGGGSSDAGLLSSITASDNAGTIFVAAAGNSGVNADVSPMYPAAYSVGNIISVAAITRDDGLAYYSNYGASSVDLGAPGSAILSTYPGATYASLSGTSMATPHVTGACALLWAQYPSLTHRQVIDLVLQGVTSKSYLSGKSVTGGILDVATSLYLGDPALNQAPIASAGGNQTIDVNHLVTLHGSASDNEGDRLTYSWALNKPNGSSASLSSSSAQSPTFTPDVVGTYTATLTVNDAYHSSVPKSAVVTVTEDVTAPVVVIHVATGGSGVSSGGTVSTGHAVVLDAGSSSDDAVSASVTLTYEWVLVSQPAGSSVSISNATQSQASFTPTVNGTYTVSLTVSDGHNESTGEVLVTATDTPTTSSGGSGGGCNLNDGSNNPWELAILLLLPFALMRRWRAN